MPPPSAKQLEARLGFNFQIGISKDPRANKTPETFQLLQRVNEINTRYISYGIKRIRQSEGIKRRTLEILEDLGPTLWPDLNETGERDTSWLLAPLDDSDPHGSEYSKDLVFSDPIDRLTITKRFRDFVEQKVLRYHNNHFKNLPTAHDPPDSDRRTNSEESEADEDIGEDAGEDGRDTPSDYRPSKPRRVQALDGVPRTGIRNKKMNTYVAPTAPMIPGSSSMGQTESKLNSANLALNRATLSEYQKHYRTSTDDRMARGSRNKPASNSGSVSDILFDINQDSPARRSPEIPLWQQDRSIGTEVRSASKRVCSVDNEAGTGRKRKKHTDEVLCPRRSLVVKLKLTRKKILQEVHRQQSRAEINAPIPPDPLVLPVDRLQSYTSLPPTQECHAPPLSLQAHRRENMAPPSSRDSRSRQQIQPSVADQPEESILYEDTVVSPLTPSSPTGRPTAAAYVNTGMEVSGDKDHQEQSQLTSQDLATQQSQSTLAAQEAASRASEALRSVGIECIGHNSRTTVHDTLPAAAPPPALDDDSRRTAILPPTTAPTTAPMTTTINAKSSVDLITDECQSADATQSTKNVVMFAKIMRDGQPEPEDFYPIAFQKLASSDDFFKNLREELNLSADDTIVRAVVKRVSELEISGLSHRWTDFTMNERRKMNIGWEALLKGLERVYKKDRKSVEMEMEVEVHLSVGKGSDKKITA